MEFTVYDVGSRVRRVGDMKTFAGRRTRGAGIALGLVVVLGAGASACGGSSSPAAAPSTLPAAKLPGNVVLASVQTTAAAKSARESMTISTGSGPMAFSMTTNGAIDFATGNSEFKSELGGPLASFLSGGLEMRVVDGVVYMKLPASIGGLFGGSGGGDQWLSITPKAGGGSNPFSNLGQSDPTQVLGALERVSDDVKEVGTATVRGVETKHYTATIDFAKAIDNAKIPKALRGKADGLFGNGAKLPAVPVDVYLDGDGHLRRMTLDMDLGSFATGASGASGVTLPTISMTLDLYDFGSPVSVQAPPANEIVQLPKLGAMGGMGGLGGLHLPSGAPALKTS
jgi:hypothetical protein